jgi:hypothetical protein
MPNYKRIERGLMLVTVDFEQQIVPWMHASHSTRREKATKFAASPA